MTVSAPGYFSGTVDGYESVLTVDALETMTAQDYPSIAPETPDPEAIGKLIHGDTWYYVTLVPAADAKDVEAGAPVQVTFARDFYVPITMTVRRIGGNEAGYRLLVLESDEYKSSRFALQTLDIPIQVRFRGSTAERYDFWRVYAGVTVSWVIKDYATLNNGTFKVRYYNLPYLQNWLFTANLQVGYGKFTLRADYTLNPLFRSSRTGDIPGLGDTRSISLGLLVYIL